MNKTITMQDGRTMELKQLDKYSVGMLVRSHGFQESYAIISLQDAKNMLKGVK